MNKINYKQVIALGFKRKEFGNDSVFFDQNGYEYFVAKQTILKTQGVKIVAYWHPETKEIELLYLKKENVISRQKFSGQHGLARYRAILEFFRVKPVVEEERTLMQSVIDQLKTVLEKQALPPYPSGGISVVDTKEQGKPRLSIGRAFDAGLLDLGDKSVFVSSRFPIVGKIDPNTITVETEANYIPIFDPTTGLFQYKLPTKRR